MTFQDEDGVGDKMSDARLEFFVNGLRTRGTAEDMELLGELLGGRQAEAEMSRRAGLLAGKVIELDKTTAELRETIRKTQDVYVQLEMGRDQLRKENAELKKQLSFYDEYFGDEIAEGYETFTTLGKQNSDLKQRVKTLRSKHE